MINGVERTETYFQGLQVFVEYHVNREGYVEVFICTFERKLANAQLSDQLGCRCASSGKKNKVRKISTIVTIHEANRLCISRDSMAKAIQRLDSAVPLPCNDGFCRLILIFKLVVLGPLCAVALLPHQRPS